MEYYNLLGQPGPYGERNPDPNLTDEQATYLYKGKPGEGDNKGLNAKGKPVDKKDVEEKLEEVGEPIRFTDGPDEGTTTTTTTPTKNNILTIQESLKELGFNPGPLDGITGPKTRAAAQAYINSLSGTEAKSAYDYYNGILGGLTAPSKETTTSTSTTNVDWWTPLGYDSPDEAYKEAAFDLTGEVGRFIEKAKAFYTNPSNQGKDFSKTSASSNSLESILSQIDGSNATRADISDRELELWKRDESYRKILRGDLSKEEWEEYTRSQLEKYKEEIQNDPTFAGKLGTWLNYAGRSIGTGITNVAEVALNVVADIGEDFFEFLLPNEGGWTDALWSGILGQPEGSTPITDITDQFKLVWDNDKQRFTTGDGYVLFLRDDDVTDEQTGSTLTESFDITIYDKDGNTQEIDPRSLDYWKDQGWSTTPITVTTKEVIDPKTGDVVIEEVVVEEEYPEGFPKRVYRKDSEFGEEVFNQDQLDGALAAGYSLENTGIYVYQPPGEGTAFGEQESTVGPGTVVSNQLNEFNNIPQGSILIEAAGQMYLGYQVPGAYGQIYDGNAMFMLYEVLGNDLVEAGIISPGGSPQVNVILGSKTDLNQYGLIVGGTDEISDDVEHPFIKFVENFENGKRINPWLNDTRINPNSGVTYQQEAIEFLSEQAIEQWSAEETQARFEGTAWYQQSTSTQRQWLTTQLTQPQTASQLLGDKQLEVKAQMESSGIESPPDALINYFAEKSVTGTWTDLYTTDQIALLADPYKPGARDTNLINFIEGVGVGSLNRTAVAEKEVQDMYRQYLGPSLGNASATEISEKAGQLRNNPDAANELKSYLEQQRLAMFPNYTNPTLRYNDIVQPYKNLVNQVWGQEADETSDWFIQMVQNNNIESAYKTLRDKGIELEIERVQNQALQDLESAIGEGSVQPNVGVNT